MKKYIIIDSYKNEVIEEFDTLEKAKKYNVDIGIDHDVEDFFIAEVLFWGTQPIKSIEWKEAK